MGADQIVTDDIDRLLEVLPVRARDLLTGHVRLDELLEVIIDLGRPLEARFPGGFQYLGEANATTEDIDYVVARIGAFDRDNRAGIERTLHRISAIPNRTGRIVGLTCRVGRAVFGTIDIIRDVIETGRNILIVGRPGVGKTTKLREVARVLAEEFDKRVIVVDTNNEIAGDGDIPHPAIGRARRMQVPNTAQQHDVMIEAVENHMPEVIVIDEIGTDADAAAARTIAERGVQLIGTAHGNNLENLMSNPTLSDLIGGIQAVTLGDEEAKRRGTQKTVLERKAPPTFDTLIEIETIDRLAIHADVAQTVDLLLLDQEVTAEVRERDAEGEFHAATRSGRLAGSSLKLPGPPRQERRATYEDDDDEELRHELRRAHAQPGVTRIYPRGISPRKLDRALRELRIAAVATDDESTANMIVSLGGYHPVEAAAARQRQSESGTQTVTVRSNTYGQIYEAIRAVFGAEDTAREQFALKELEEAAHRATVTDTPVELLPQNAYIRRLQHELGAKLRVQTKSIGCDPRRRVKVYPE